MFRVTSTAAQVGGRSDARRLLATAAMCLAVALPVTAAPQRDPAVDMSEDGVFTVSATFTIPQTAFFASLTLTDYSRIPRFMPEVRVSNVLERTDGRAIVEQEAVARFMMFSKRIHLVLEIEEELGVIRFRDRCGKSFARYEGRWLLEEKHGYTQLTYELTAQPSFEVPQFLLKRLLKRDATRMIENLKAEISARARQSLH
jgi:hypothetical protein